jgi:hypothetical protein
MIIFTSTEIIISMHKGCDTSTQETLRLLARRIARMDDSFPLTLVVCIRDDGSGQDTLEEKASEVREQELFPLFLRDTFDVLDRFLSGSRVCWNLFLQMPVSCCKCGIGPPPKWTNSSNPFAFTLPSLSKTLLSCFIDRVSFLFLSPLSQSHLSLSLSLCVCVFVSIFCTQPVIRRWKSSLDE